MSFGKFIAFVSTAAFALSGVAAEISFNGSVDNDLTNPENWDGGVLPTAADTIVLPVSAANTAFTLPTGLSVKGITVKPFNSFSVSGAGKLTIGDSGLLIDRTYEAVNTTFTFGVPIATVADQVWDLRGVKMSTSGTFSGTSNLTITNMNEITHNTALGYFGRIGYYGVKDHKVNYNSTETWSTGEVYFYKCRPILNGTGTYNFSDIFKAKVVQDGWGSSGVNMPNKADAVLNFKAGDWITMGGDNSYIGPGTFNMSGGIYNTVGLVSLRDNGLMNISGDASFSGSSYGLIVGPEAKEASKISARVVQSGGAVTNKCFVQIGGRGGNAKAVGEYRLEGGILTAGNSLTDGAVDRGMNLTASRASCGADPCAAIFTQVGGTSRISAVNFGSSASDWDATVNCFTNGFSLLSLQGGDFYLGKMGIILGSSWNTYKVDSVVTPCPWAEGRYRFSFSGGKFIPYSDNTIVEFKQNVQWDIPPSDSCATVDCSKASFVQNAPISGDGTLVMHGAKGGEFTDLARFTGKLVLSGGTNRFVGATLPSGKYDDGCVIFRADDAAQGKEDNDEVAVWSDSTGTKSVTTLSSVVAAATNCCLNPKVKLNDFNGHAGLSFARNGLNVTALGMASVDNPLVGCNDYTVAVVFKTTVHGSCSSGSDYQYAYSTGILGTSISYGNNGMGISISGDSGNVDYILSGRSYDSNQSGVGSADKFTRTKSAPKQANDGKVHVFVTSSSGQMVRSSFDGWCEERNRGMLDTTKKYLIGCTRFSEMPNGSPLMIGVCNDQAWKEGNPPKATPNRGYVGTIAEIRIYPNRCMSMGELSALSFELNQKYNPSALSESEFIGASNCIVAGDWVDVKDEPVALPEGATEFNAGSATVAEGSEVTTLPSADGTISATSVTGGGLKGPTLVKSGPGKKPMLRFTAAEKTALGVANSVSPVSGVASFAVAVVFRTTTDGLSADSKRAGRGLVSTVQSSVTGNDANDLAIEFQSDGTIATVVGNGNYKFSRKPCRLADGQVHVAILNADQNADVMTQMVDGLPQYASLPDNHARNICDLLIGSLCKTKDSQYFDGDIAAVALWDRALTREEMDQVTEHYAQEYSFYPLAKGKFTAADLTERGVAAKEICVEDGAALRIIESKDNPFTLGLYQTLTGEGSVLGSVCWGAGSVYDTAVAAKNVHDVQLNGATVKFVAGSLPLTIANLSSISGEITLDVSAAISGKPDLRVKLIDVAPGVVKSGTTFSIVGAEGTSRAYYDESRGGIVLYSPRGGVILLR